MDQRRTRRLEGRIGRRGSLHHHRNGETAADIGKAGKDGMKVTKGTITKIDNGTKTVVLKSAFEYADDAVKGMGKLSAKVLRRVPK